MHTFANVQFLYVQRGMVPKVFFQSQLLFSLIVQIICISSQTHEIFSGNLCKESYDHSHPDYPQPNYLQCCEAVSLTVQEVFICMIGYQ
jgi:hypothetical protein